MRIIMFLMLSGFLLSQPVKKDTVVEEPIEEIPAVVKPTVEEIVINSEEARKASSELNKEMKKQLDIIRDIKKGTTLIKKPIGKVKKVELRSQPRQEKEMTIASAIKPDTVNLKVNGQLVKYEYKEKTVFGLVFFSGYYPYILDQNKKKIYLKK